MYYLIFSFIIAGVAFMCESQQEYIIQPVGSVDSVEIAEMTDTNVKLNIEAMVPNPCYKFSHYTTQQNADTVKIFVYAKILKDVTCIQMIGKIKCEIELEIDTSQSYQLKFPGKFKALSYTLKENK